MRAGIALVLAAASLLVFSCGQPAENKEVEQAYLKVVDALMARDGHTVYSLSSENSRVFLDRLAEAMNSFGQSGFSNGGDMLNTFLGEEDFSDLSRTVSSVSIAGNTATLIAGGETLTLFLEEGSWKLDIEGMFRQGLEEGLEGSGLTVDDILEGNFQGLNGSLSGVPEGYTVGAGPIPVTFTNGLGNWDVHAVFIDPSSEPEWSEERLGATYILTQGQSFTVMVVPGTYDIRLVDNDGDTYSRWEVPIGTGGYQWTVTLEDLD